MTFDEEVRNKLSIKLNDEQQIVDFFKRNREKLNNDNNSLDELVSNTKRLLKENPDQTEVGAADLVEMIGLLATRTFKTISDLMDITQIAFLQNVQLRKQVNEQLNEKEDKEKGKS